MKMNIDALQFTAMSWLDRLFWKKCSGCNELFKREPGWKSWIMSLAIGGINWIYYCGGCCPTAEAASQAFEED